MAGWIRWLVTSTDRIPRLRFASEEWVQPTLAANWSDVGSPFVASGYYRDPWGRVHLQGSVTKAAALAAPETLFTLPADHRPPGDVLFVVSANGTTATIRVEPDGDVRLDAGGSATRTTLDGVSFRAAPA